MEPDTTDDKIKMMKSDDSEMSGFQREVQGYITLTNKLKEYNEYLETTYVGAANFHMGISSSGKEAMSLFKKKIADLEKVI